MYVITLVQEKGGVGKTSFSLNFGAEFARRDYRVLLVDADPQANLTSGLQVKEAPCIYDLLVRESGWQDVLKAVPQHVYEGAVGRLFMLPGNMETRAIPNQLADQFALMTRLKQVENLFDLVIIDTPPTPSLFHNSILIATDAVIIPTQAEAFSIRQTQKTIFHMEQISSWKSKAGMGEIELLGIVPNLYQSNTITHRENLNDLEKHYGDKVWTPVARRIVWTDASSAQLPVIVYAPDSEAASEVAAMVNRIEEANSVSA